MKVLVVGAGLAGSEAAMFLARKNIKVVLVESKCINKNPSQKLDGFGELVCSNSLKSKEFGSAHGLLKLEMQELGSIIMEAANATQVPAGGALAVDRKKFSDFITEKINAHPNIEVIEKEVSNPIALAKEYECQHTIIASGPLTTTPLEQWIKAEISGDDFYFYDAIAPVVESDSLDHSKLYFKDRYGKDDNQGDYLNAPLNKEEYDRFFDALVEAKKVPARDFEKFSFFESCLPIDVMAERGRDTPRFSCMKPVGLELPDGTLPYAVVQLRRENLLGDAYNLVGFQTRLTHKEQLRVFRMIPGLEEATFVHLGSIHRNSFINSKKLLDNDFCSQKYPDISFAGQIAGVEGYTESAACGIYVANQLYAKLTGKYPHKWPVETAIGALINYVMTNKTPSPSNINFGLLPSVTLSKEERKNRKMRKKLKKEKAFQRGREIFAQFLSDMID